VTITPSLGEYYAVTANSGGFAIPLTQTGKIDVTFSGRVSGVRSITVGEESVLLDFLATPEAGDHRLYLPMAVQRQ
jgi:hypothetical protein